MLRTIVFLGVPLIALCVTLAGSPELGVVTAVTGGGWLWATRGTV